MELGSVELGFFWRRRKAEEEEGGGIRVCGIGRGREEEKEG